MHSNELLQLVQPLIGDKITSHEDFRDDLTLVVQPAHLLDVVHLLRNSNSLGFAQLCDINAVDYEKKQPERFAVIYHLYSHSLRAYLRLKVPVADTGAAMTSNDLQSLPQVPSIAGIWRAANWLERETYDMFGICFAGHPNLQRILMTETMQGYPLRKDFPLHGPPEWPTQDKFKTRPK